MWNPDLYPNADKYDPTRFLKSAGAKSPPANTFVPFEGGYKLCAGQELARLSMLVFLHQFLKTIKWSSVDPEEKILYKFLVYPEKGLPIRIQKCKL
ncbi:hypothetical protein Mapa_013638 [Marchantia paleacea]|nr:hypothetical protein Mapa_013638 [Marchantia paleacea]